MKVKKLETPHDMDDFLEYARRPEAVEFTSIESDVKRRDLTINALFYDMNSGEVVDYVGGIEENE